MISLFKNKGFLGLVLLFIIGMFFYNTFIPTDTTLTDNSALVVGKDLLKLSDDLSKAELSQSLFTVPGYLYLTDFAAPLFSEPMGRANPFDVIGR